MRLPFPERIPLSRVAIFCAGLNALQLLEGTTLLFTLCSSAFILFATIAFNMAGGLTRPSGAYIFSYTMLAGLFGITYKALIGEPGQSNLQQPELTIEVYAATTFALLISIYIARRLLPKKPLFPNFSSNSDLRYAAVTCLTIALTSWALAVFGPSAPAAETATEQQGGTFATAFSQLNYFALLGMLLAIIYEIRRTGGRRSMNLTAFGAGAFIFMTGIFDYSKQGIFTPFACWFFTAASQRYRISLLQVAGLLATAAFTVYYLVPYSQYGRTFHSREASYWQNAQTSLYLLSRLDQVRASNTQQEQINLETHELVIRYYNSSQGLADRLTMIPPDDSLINTTENGAVFGIFPTLFSFENLIPHFIWHSKPTLSFGNIYAHEVGILTNPEDTTTGISFSPSGDAYHQAKWIGILVVYPILLIMLFYLADTCFGDTRDSPFALLVLVLMLHTAPEGGITVIAKLALQIVPAVFMLGLLCIRVFPLLARSFSGRKKSQFLPASVSATSLPPQRDPVVPEAASTVAPYRWSTAATRE